MRAYNWSKYRGRKIDTVPSILSELGEGWLITWAERPFYKSVRKGFRSGYITTMILCMETGHVQFVSVTRGQVYAGTIDPSFTQFFLSQIRSIILGCELIRTVSVIRQCSKCLCIL
jgi:hypothetical protein